MTLPPPHGDSPSESALPFALPDQRTLTRWLFATRGLFAVSALALALIVWTTTPDVAFIVSVAVLVAAMMTVYGAWSIFIRKAPRGLGFILSQAVVDLGLVTVLVHFGGGLRSAVAALYVVVIAAYGLLLPMRQGIIIALLAPSLYLADTMWGQRDGIHVGVWGQVGVFAFVFVLVAVLGQRLRAASAEQSQLQSELRRVRLEADEILMNIRAGVMTVDGNGRLAFINPTAERLLELPNATYLGQPVLDEIALRAPALHQAISAGVKRGRRVSRAEGEVARRDGSRFPIGLSTTTFERAAQMVPAVTVIFSDISDMKQLQELHLRAERLEAVAALSASLAHEIRNPLAAIRSSVEQLAASAQADDDARLLGRLIVRESDRLSRLLGEFLDFSRVRATHFAAVDLHMVALESARLVREHPDCGADVRVHVHGQRTLIDADEDLLHRVVNNLVLNAAQALHGVGEITVTVDTPKPAEVPSGGDFEYPVRLVVEDNGPGIDPEVRERLFEPFVSGRPGGSGLGLAIVQRAVEAHRGLVLVDSEAGRGTRFTIYLHANAPSEDAE